MKKLLALFLIFLSWQGFAQEVRMTPSEISTFKKTVTQKTESITTIRTDFKQEKKLSFLSHPVLSTGKMFLTAKGALKWAYLTPNKYSITFMQNAVYINDNGDKSTVKGNQKLFQKLSHLIAGSVSGKLFNDPQFTISFFKKGKENIVKLAPKEKVLKRYIKEVYLFIPAHEGVVSQVKLIEPSGDYTFIHFINKKINVQIPQSVFAH